MMLAYVDPGSGSYLIQILVASFLAVAYMARTYWLAVVAWVRSFFRRSGAEDKSRDGNS